MRFSIIGLLLSSLALTACQGANFNNTYAGRCVPRAYDAGLCNSYMAFGPVNPRGGTASAGF